MSETLDSIDSDSNSENEDFYTPGDEALYETRCELAKESLKRAKKRVEFQYSEWKSFNEEETLKYRRGYYLDIKSNLSLVGSEFVSSRFTSCINSNSKDLLVGSWDGYCYVVDPTSFQISKKFQHGDKISDIDVNESSHLLLTGGFDSKIKIYDINSDTDSTLNGHLNRVTKTKFHPFEPLCMSSSWDETWRMWDLNKSVEIYYQEGHIGSVNTIDLHIDGSLLLSGGADSVIKLWDLRTGQLVADFIKDGHAGSVHALKFRSNGYQFLSGGSDHNVIAWDLRRSQKLSDIPVHSSLVTDIDISKDDLTLITSSYDGSVALTECDSWKPIKKFDSVVKVMGVAVSSANDIYSVGWDGGVKVYSIE